MLITCPGTYGGGNYRLGANIAGPLIFKGPARLDLAGYTVDRRGSGNAKDFGIVMQAAKSIVVGCGGKVTGARAGIHLAGAQSKIYDVDVSGNRYFGAWLEADDCQFIGGRCASIGGVSDEKYAIGIQCDAARPIVRGVRFDELYIQVAYKGSSAGDALPVNFSANASVGTMENCVAVNSVPRVNTYGVFGGEGGSHTIRHNLFVNFWRGISHAPVGTADISGNIVRTSMHLAGSYGIASGIEHVSDNVVVGYDNSFDGVRGMGDLSLYEPNSIASRPKP